MILNCTLYRPINIFFQPSFSAGKTQKLKEFKEGLDTLLKWDELTHSKNNRVFISMKTDELIKQAETFLQRQKESGFKITPFMIGITGASASGKTFVKNLFLKLLSKQAESRQWNEQHHGPLIEDIAHDNFYLNQEHRRASMTNIEFRKTTNLDEPKALRMDKLQQAVELFRSGVGLLLPHYDMITCRRTDNSAYKPPAPFMILEGIFALLNQPLHHCFDLKIYVDTDTNTISRRWWDRAESRGISNDEGGQAQFQKVMEMYKKHIEPTKEHANVVLNGSVPETTLKEAVQGFSNLLLKTFYPIQTSEFEPQADD